MQQKRRKFRPRVHTGPCSFCESNTSPDYKDPERLQRLVTDRGKILSRLRNGLCQKHQRRLAREIKRARHLALIAFVAAR